MNTERRDYFVDVILPLALPQTYTYRLPQSMNGAVFQGQRVVVQFGKSKMYSAIVKLVHETAPKYTAKYIEAILDAEPVVVEKQLEFWDWLSRYYMCTQGEVMITALPAGLRLTSESKIGMSVSFDGNKDHLNEEELNLVEAIDVRGVLTMEEVSTVLDRKTVYPVIRKLIAADVISVHEEIKERYRPKYESVIALNDKYKSEDEMRAVFDKLEKRAFKQLETLMAFIHLSGKAQEMRRADLLADRNADASALASLVKKGILDSYDREVSRIKSDAVATKEAVLSTHQTSALEKIKEGFADKSTVLLHGVTSSGKTEVYTHLIREQLENGKQVLFLLPEIALTTQLIGRLQEHFGAAVLIYHSRFNEQERVEVYNEVLKKKPCVVIGARSSLFLPYSNLGLIIIDEEHDPSFKQQDPAPRYNARESALWLAKIHKANTLLGSATPSVESYYNAKHGLYGYATMTERFGGAVLPKIFVADVKEATKRKMMKSVFTPYLLERIDQVLADGEQVILFQNRRGFAPSIECQTCGHVPHCVRCDVSLTYHKAANQLRCHICGFTSAPPTACDACGTTDLKLKGFGTEKIEEELGLLLPAARIARMDLDTTRGKFSLQNIIADFESGKTNVLVGTQMVTKGLDFGNVGLVGILSADQILNFPDFRSYERAFQLMAQVSGRAGRREKQGEVIIQSFNPQHFIIQCVVNNDYETMYHNELADRMQFSYPPLFRLIRITVKGKDALLVDNGSFHLASQLRTHMGSRILGPEYPVVARMRDEYIKNILIKTEREASVVKIKDTIQTVLNDFKVHPDFKKLRLVIDVDPN